MPVDNNHNGQVKRLPTKGNVVDIQDILERRRRDKKPIIVVLPEIEHEPTQESFANSLKRTSNAFEGLKESDPEFYQELVNLCNEGRFGLTEKDGLTEKNKKC